MSDAPKSAYEIAMEKLKERDRERGESAPATLSGDQKARIAEIRRVHEARIAEREILFRGERGKAIARLEEDPEALKKVEQEYARDRRRIEEEREAKIAAVRSQGSGGAAAGAPSRKGRGGKKSLAVLLVAGLGLGALPVAATAAGPNAGAEGKSQAPRVIAIRAARLIDGTDAPRRRGAVVLIEGDRIRSVAVTDDAGTSGAAAIPPGAEVVDLGDATLLPGLIDAHTHVLLQGDATERDYSDQILKESVAHRTVRAVAAARAALMNGFTTIRDLGTEGAGYADVALRDGIAEGIVPGPRMFVATLAIDITGAYPLQGYDLASPVPSGVQVADGPDAGRAAVREQIKHGADWIKVYCDRGYFVDAAGNLDSIPTFEPEELKAIVDEAHRQGHRVAAHVYAPKGLRRALDAGVDTIEHGVGLDAEAVRRMAAQGVFYCPTLTVMQNVAPERATEGRSVWDVVPDFHRKSFAAALKGGVRIAFGTDAGGFPWSENEAQEFVWMVKYGMTPAQAIRSATTVAAALLGLEKEIGRVAPGYRADLVAVPGDPLADITLLQHVGFVMAGGKVFRNEIRSGG
jgi:imidazolonepropionase-like amidohydrolase